MNNDKSTVITHCSLLIVHYSLFINSKGKQKKLHPEKVFRACFPENRPETEKKAKSLFSFIEKQAFKNDSVEPLRQRRPQPAL